MRFGRGLALWAGTGLWVAVLAPALALVPAAMLDRGPDGTARVWDLDSEETFMNFAGHQGPVTSLAVDKAGTTVITASADGTAKIWAAESTAEEPGIHWER